MIDYATLGSAAVLELHGPQGNALSLELLAELRECVDRAVADPQILGLVITGEPERFSVGADLSLFDSIRSGDDAVRVSRLFQEAFQAIEDCPKPVVAAVAGHVLGGGLELAMACHYRVAAEGSRFSMPEVHLGINPGAGGTQRLPRLVGLELGLEMLLTGRVIDCRQALEAGLIDVVVPSGELLSAARWVEEPPPWPHTGRRTDKIADPATNLELLAQAAQRVAAGRPELVAPRKILAAVQTGVQQSLADGLACEQEVFRQCMETPSTQNRIYIACARRQTARHASLAGATPRTIVKAGVLGLGTMGAGIAQALVAAGIDVIACDLDPAALERARQRVESSLRRRVEQGKLAPAKAEAALARLRLTTDPHQLELAQLVVEAVFEDVEVKRTALARLEGVCSPEALLATNTSTINLDVLAGGMAFPNRLVGLHFFHPAQQMPLVEVIGRRGTPPDILATAVGVTKALGKTPVVVQNREGFAVNRLFIPYLIEAFRLLEEGVSPEAIDRAMTDFGLPMGPLQLIDLSGLDILEKTWTILHRVFPHHGPLSPIVHQLIAGGHLGQKSGAGVYRYEPGDRTPRPHLATEQAIAAARRSSASPPAAEQIVARLMLRMVAEAFALLEEGVVDRPADLDVALVLGIGLPDYHGGIVGYARGLGLDQVVSHLERLARDHGPGYAPCPLLIQAAENPRILNH